MSEQNQNSKNKDNSIEDKTITIQNNGGGQIFGASIGGQVNVQSISASGSFIGDINQLRTDRSNLVEAVILIQQLIEDMDAADPIETTSDKYRVTGEIIKHIEENPKLRKQLTQAVVFLGRETLKKILVSPVGAIILSVLENWAEIGLDRE